MKIVHSIIIAAALVILLSGCASDQQTGVAGRPHQKETIARDLTTDPHVIVIEAVSLRGDALIRPEFDADTRAKFEENLATVRAEYERDPHDEANIIWFGRRLAYLGRYTEALGVFSRGIAEHRESFRLRRHAGHRLITLRRLDDAIAHLALAADFAREHFDEIEPDGQPNALNIPRSTTKFNIWYHLGLAHFLKGEFAEAERAYRECMKVSQNDDLLVATTHWLYMTLRRLGRDDKARALLAPIHAEMEIIENDAYHKLCLMYRGEIAPAELLRAVEGEDLDFATVSFGIGHWHLVEGRPEEAHALFGRITRETGWAAFGHIAAEAELARAGR